MPPRFAAALLAGLMLLAAAVAARQQRGGRGAPGTPDTILSVVVEVGQSTVQAVSARAVRGQLRTISQDALMSAPHGPHEALIEYTATSKAARAPFTSVFHVSFISIVERSPRQMPPASSSTPSQSVTIAIAVPDLPPDAVISFARLEPIPGIPPDKWKRMPMGQVTLPPVRR